jgi:hypothetical protein
MRKYVLTLILTVAVAMPAAAQRINLDQLRDLEDRAEEVVDVTLDADMLRLAAKFLGSSRDEREIQSLVSKLTGIYVRSYSFAEEGQYDRGLVNRIKSQLGSSWKPLVTVRSKKKENVNIWADMRGEQIIGLVVVSAEPRELTVVNIVGPIDIDRLAQLEGQFGIPRMTEGKGKDK